MHWPVECASPLPSSTADWCGNSINGALLSTWVKAGPLHCKAAWTDSYSPCMWLETWVWFRCRYTWTSWDLPFGDLVSLCLLEQRFFPCSHQYAAMSPPKCFSSLGSCDCCFRLARYLRSLPLFQLIRIPMDDFAFQCSKISKGTSTCFSLTFCSRLISGTIPTEADWTLAGNKAAIREDKKMFSPKSLPFSFLWRKMCKLADAESEP